MERTATERAGGASALAGDRRQGTAAVALMVPLLAAGLVGPAADAIITRHDREDARYLALGQRYGSALVAMNLEDPGDRPDGHGVLVAPRWVLTAAHVATEVEPGHELTVGGADYGADAVVLHPGWDGGAGDDIALIRLATAVAGVAPVRLHEGSDEVGRTVIVVGRGDLGTGRTGPTGNDRRLRGATNRVDGADEGLLWWRFDAPGDSGVTDLEGISGPGDSGGPALLDADGTVSVVGVSSSQSTRATGGREGLYGVTEYYVRVSGYDDWLRRTMSPTTEEADIETVATGTFDVELTPQPDDHEAGRMLIDKEYRGDLVGTGRGQMLTWRDEDSGAAAYVAIERVTGTLDGRTGSFALAHRGTMTADAQDLSVTVVPGSGTDGLIGLAGTMSITIVDGRHDYRLEYGLGDAR